MTDEVVIMEQLVGKVVEIVGAADHEMKLVDHESEKTYTIYLEDSGMGYTEDGYVEYYVMHVKEERGIQPVPSAHPRQGHLGEV